MIRPTAMTNTVGTFLLKKDFAITDLKIAAGGNSEFRLEVNIIAYLLHREEGDHIEIKERDSKNCFINTIVNEVNIFVNWFNAHKSDDRKREREREK